MKRLTCNHTCKYYKFGYCNKYKTLVNEPLHPYYYLTQYLDDGHYSSDNGTELIVSIAERYLIDKEKDKLAISIISYYRKHNELSIKQKAVLVKSIIYCYTDR